MRIEVYDVEGNRYTITLEGQVTREKALRILDLIELLGGIPNLGPVSTYNPRGMSKIDKIKHLIEKRFPFGWFRSKEIQEAYEEEFNESISLSTVSTYLSRLTSRGFLLMETNSRVHRYRMVTEITGTKIQLLSRTKKQVGGR